MLIAVESHLKTGLGPGGSGALKSVDGAFTLDALGKRPPQTHQLPAAFVVPVQERAGDSTIVGGTRQRVAKQFGVLLAIGARNDPRGDSLSGQIDDLSAAVKAHLVGWQPSAEHEPTLYRGAREYGMANAVGFWFMQFETAVQEGD